MSSTKLGKIYKAAWFQRAATGRNGSRSREKVGLFVRILDEKSVPEKCEGLGEG
jgi:hypothetical protein